MAVHSGDRLSPIYARREIHPIAIAPPPFTATLSAHLAVGLGLTLASLSLWDGGWSWPGRQIPAWLLVGALATVSLWGLRSGLHRRPTPLTSLYRQATDHWAWGLWLTLTLCLTLHSLLLSQGLVTPSGLTTAATAVGVGAVLWYSWGRPQNSTIYALGWSGELLQVEAVSLFNQSLIALAVANILVGLFTQVVGDWLHRRGEGERMLSSWHVMPLLYGGLGAVLRSNAMHNWTGLTTLGLVLITAGVGRRRPEFRPLVYLAILGVTLTAWEVVGYQIRGLATADQILALAALAVTLMYAYRLLAPWLAQYFRLPVGELHRVAHLHWALGSGLLLLVPTLPAAQNPLVGVGAGFSLASYAIAQGRDLQRPRTSEVWVYLGLLETAALAFYGSSLRISPALVQLLLPWATSLASILALVLYSAPWRDWGWPPRPWRVASVALPVLSVIATVTVVHPVSLLMAAGFYGLLAYLRRQIRWSYGAVVLVDGAVVQGLVRGPGITPFVWATLLGLLILYVAWVDTYLRVGDQRSLRHQVRLMGCGLICLAALVLHHQTGILPGIVSLVAIFLGLALRIRAFLYVGTIVFLLNAIYQMVILSFLYPLLKWIIGLIAGLVFILIAASFETHRAQLSTLLQNWNAQLRSWE